MDKQDGQAESSIPAVLALVKDLFFGVRIKETLKKLGYQVETVQREAAFREKYAALRPGLVIVETAITQAPWEDLVREIKREANPPPILAFGSHMDLDARKRALAAGCTQVVGNSKLSEDLPGLVQRYLPSLGAAGSAFTEG